MKNELKITQESSVMLAKTKKMLGLSSKLLSKDQPLSLRTATTNLSQALIAERYRDEGDGTLTDLITGLQWQRISVGQRWVNRECVGEAEKYKWDEAFEIAQSNSFAGYQDWRLPTKEELHGLVYSSSGLPNIWLKIDEKCEGDYQQPTIVEQAFPNTYPSVVWSSSQDIIYSISAWGINFYNGYTHNYNLNYNFHVRLVR